MRTYTPVFETQFDVIVYGSGYAALAAAWGLAVGGRSVLLCDRSFDLAWESGRAFAAQAGECTHPLWQDFFRELGARNLYRGGLLDSAGAEVCVCHRLRNAPANLHVLLGASVVAANWCAGTLKSVRVATKSGERLLRASAWIDASEQATLFDLAVRAGLALAGGLPWRAPAAFEQRVVLRAAGIDALAADNALAPDNTRQPDAGRICGGGSLAAFAGGEQTTLRLEKRLWKDELTLCLSSPEPLALPLLSELAQAARSTLGAEWEQAAIVQFSSETLPVFAGDSVVSGNDAGASDAGSGGAAADSVDSLATGGAVVCCGDNLYSATAVLACSQVRFLAERFALGIAAAEALSAHNPLHGGLGGQGNLSVGGFAGESACMDDATAAGALPERLLECDVLVAGGGSAGAVAALAAAREGASVLVLDAASTAGGIATGGLITGYFHGHPGGLFESLDASAAEVREGLDPAKKLAMGGKHQDAKKIAFEQTLARSGATQFIGGVTLYAAKVQDGRVTQVLAAGAQCVYRVHAAAVIDATGDGDLCALAGAQYVHGRMGDGRPLSYSQPCLRVTDVSGSGSAGAGACSAVAGSTVAVRGSNFDSGWVDATDPQDMTRARITGIAQYWGCAFTGSEHLMKIAPLLGLRQSRQIRTLATLTLDDVICHNTFADSIGTVRSPMDTHSVDFEFEDDQMLFWLWGCKNFRGETHSQMPYRALIPEGLRNVWIACRASGISVSAAYGVRMLRDVQRMGEAAGVAAAAAARLGCDASAVPLAQWQPQLAASGALAPCAATDNWQEDPLAQLDQAEAGGYLWALYRDPARYRTEVTQRLGSGNPHISWLAAVVLAMWEDPLAEPRLLRAIEGCEQGQPTPRSALGAHGQWIDVPNWYLAVSLLRLCGTAACLPVLLELAKGHSPLLNVRTAIGLTTGRLHRRFVEAGANPMPLRAQVAVILSELSASPLPETLLRPSRSLYRALLGQEQTPLRQEPQGVDSREDHLWQLWLVVARACKEWGLPCPVDVTALLRDERALVRRAMRNL